MHSIKHFNKFKVPLHCWYFPVKTEREIWKFKAYFHYGKNINHELYRCFSYQTDFHHLSSTFHQSEKEILERWKSKYLIKRQYYEAVFVLGAMCSGKTTIINRDFRQYELYQHYSFVDTDEIMELIDGFHPDKVDVFYPIARMISIKLTDWLLDENISFVAEGTCVKYKELEEYILRLKEKGYKIKVKRVASVPLSLVLERAKHRTHRQVSEEVIKDIYFHSEIGINKLFESNKEKNLFDEL